ncbi:MAG: S8 family serine peptidase [Anaerolineales bacterium]|nr:S8 family serine peptidase [Anaerolineales bacterium]
MPEAKIRYGGTELALQKSSELIGLRPARRDESALGRALAHHGAVDATQRLGNFQLVNVADAAEPADVTLDQLRNEPSVEVGTHVYYTSEDAVPFVPTGSLYIVFADDAPLAQCQDLLDQHHLEVIEVRSERAVITQVTSQSMNPVKTAAALQTSDCVAVAEPEFATPGKLTGVSLQFDTFLDRQWHLNNTGTVQGSPLNLKAGADARVLAAWGAMNGFGSRESVVAVIDDGFDLTHPDLSGPGKVVAPWDFTRRSNDPSPEYRQGYPFFDAQQGRWIGDWHGTACAGVAVGEVNGSGILGAAPQARLMPVRWGVNLADSEVESWFDYVRQQGAWVVSCSWSAVARNFPLSTRKQQAIARCAREGRNGLGAVICFAAGNEARDINDPAGDSVNGFAIHPDVVAVAASTSRDERSHYSNFGKAIAVCAPSSGSGGRGILTSDVTGVFTANGVRVDAGYSAGDFTATFGGTSSATPLVAGVCALVLAVNPRLSAAAVKQILQATARKIGDPADYTNGHSPRYGYGCIDAAAAVAAARAQLVAAVPVNGSAVAGANGANGAHVVAGEPKKARRKTSRTRN